DQPRRSAAAPPAADAGRHAAASARAADLPVRRRRRRRAVPGHPARLVVHAALALGPQEPARRAGLAGAVRPAGRPAHLRLAGRTRTALALRRRGVAAAVLRGVALRARGHPAAWRGRRMKFLLLLALLAGLFFVLGAKRSPPREPESRTPPPRPEPQAML